MTPVILVTFAGRQKRMRILEQYIRKAIDRGIIDEWHIWDFTRSADDHDWLTRDFGPVAFMASTAAYQAVGTVGTGKSFRTSVNISNDLHIAVCVSDGSGDVYEIVVGGWGNTHSALRKISADKLVNFERGDNPNIWTSVTPGVLSTGAANDIVFGADENGVATLRVNGVNVGQWPDINLVAGASIMLRGGWGGDLEICDVKAPIRRYIGNREERIPFWQSYAYYEARLNRFSDALFLKCDDDIVYMDLDKLDAFINFRRNNPDYFVVSANVVNNGVCAYWQQQAGSLPASLGDFERPPGGFGGTLWQSAERAVKLHEFFLGLPEKQVPLPEKVIEWKERQSINFIAWMGQDLRHMANLRNDDEHMLTVSVPEFVGRPSAIYSDFTVSHLSFGPQERGMQLEPLIEAYDVLMREKLSA